VISEAKFFAIVFSGNSRRSVSSPVSSRACAAGFSHLLKSELLLGERGTAARKITGAPFVVASRDNYDTRRGNARRKSNSGEKKRPGASRA